MIYGSGEQLTPDLVRAVTFSTVKFGRRGLDEQEVQAFCQWVSEGLERLLNDNSLLQAEITRLRSRLLEGKGSAGLQPEDAHVQAVQLLSRAQQTADQYVSDAQAYSRDLAEDARLRRDEILREAKVRASMVLEQAHASATEAATAVVGRPHPPLDESERRELEAEVTYLRTFSDVCRTHLRAYMESLTRSIEEWEQAERRAATAARSTVINSA